MKFFVRTSAVVLLFAVGVLSAQDSHRDTIQMKDGCGISNDPAPATVTVKGLEEPVYQCQDVTTRPRLIKSKPPKFTEQARRGKMQGIVLLLVVVTKEGGVSDIRVNGGLGLGLDEEAVKAIRKWKFAPAIKDGKPVAIQLGVEVDFHLY